MHGSAEDALIGSWATQKYFGTESPTYRKWPTVGLISEEASVQSQILLNPLLMNYKYLQTACFPQISGTFGCCMQSPLADSKLAN